MKKKRTKDKERGLMKQTQVQAPIVSPLTKDLVNSPDHYTSGGIETIDYIEAKADAREYIGFLKWTAVKYLTRARKKEGEPERVAYEKAQWYINRMLDRAI